MATYPVVNTKTGEQKEVVMSVTEWDNWRENNPDWTRDYSDPSTMPGVSNMKQIYGNINSKLKKYVFSDTVNTKVLKNIHGDSSGVRGAADLGRSNDTI